MKKALLSLFLAFTCMPVFAQTKSVVVEHINLVRCTPFFWSITDSTYSESTVVTVTRPDTVYVLDLTIDPDGIIRDTVNVTANCTYIWRDSLTFHTSGLDSARVLATSGCDSVHYFNLTINGDFDTLMLDTTVCGYYMAPWGERLTHDTIIDTNYTTEAGCQRRDSLILKVNPTYNMPPVIKEADCSYTWRAANDLVITDTMIHSFKTRGTNAGCDSIINIKVNMSFHIDTTYDTVVCDKYIAPWDNIYTATGTHVHRDTSATGCITTTTVELTVNNSFTDTAWALNNTIDTTIGCYLTWGDTTIKNITADTVLRRLSNVAVNGCDSVAAVHVIALSHMEDVDTTVTPCFHPYRWHPYTGKVHSLSNSGVYRDTNITGTGENTCTTHYTLNLNFGDSISNKYAKRKLRCEFDSLKIGTPRYSFRIENGDTVVRKYANNNMTIVDIDSIFTYNSSKKCTTYFKIGLNIMQPIDTTRTNTKVACDKYQDLTFNHVFTKSIDTSIVHKGRPDINSYSDLNVDIPHEAAACYNRIYTLNLTINNSDTLRRASDTVTSCDKYVWPFNDSTYIRTTNIYRKTKDTTIHGCAVYCNLNLTINNTPLSYITGDWMLAPDGSTTLHAVSQDNNLTYAWYENGTYAADGDTYEVADRNNHENIDILLTASNGNGCPDSNWLTIVFAPIGIDDVEGVDVSIFPNPATRFVNLRTSEAISTVSVFNAIGQQVMLRQGDGEDMQIDLTGLASGHYTMRIRTIEGHEAIRKFIVNK